jgi:valyl-tRNA synthetase
MAKVRLKAGDLSPLPVLAHVLDVCQRLLHPFMPFVTEAAWQELRRHVAWAEEGALMVAPWPGADRRWLDAQAEADAEAVMEVARAIRNIRAERGVEAARYVEAYVASQAAWPIMETARPIVETLARVRPLHVLKDETAVPRDGVATAVLSQVQVALPLAGLIDVAAERARVSKQLAGAESEVQRTQAKLANEAFRARAPRHVVAREEEKLVAARARLEALRQRLQTVEQR